MSASVPDSTGIITFRAPELIEKFKKKHPEHGKRTRVLKALLQMYLKGEIKEVKYVETVT